MLNFISAGNIFCFNLNLSMQAITIKSLKAETHPQTKGLFWYLFVGSRGARTRVKIISQIRRKPSNKNQLSQDLGLEYKNIGHHLSVLEKNNIVTKFGENYGAIYVVSTLFEESELLFDELVNRLKKIGGNEWLR